jgi:hypothetical protein
MSYLLFPSFGLEAVIVPPKSRFRAFEFNAEFICRKTPSGTSPNDPRPNGAVVLDEWRRTQLSAYRDQLQDNFGAASSNIRLICCSCSCNILSNLDGTRT